MNLIFCNDKVLELYWSIEEQLGSFQALQAISDILGVNSVTVLGSIYCDDGTEYSLKHFTTFAPSYEIIEIWQETFGTGKLLEALLEVEGGLMDFTEQ